MKKLLGAAAIMTGVTVTVMMAATGPAYAPSKGDSQNMLQKQIDEQQKRDNKDVDRAYNETMKHTGKGATKPYDPWGSVRPADKK